MDNYAILLKPLFQLFKQSLGGYINLKHMDMLADVCFWFKFRSATSLSSANSLLTSSLGSRLKVFLELYADLNKIKKKVF